MRFFVVVFVYLFFYTYNSFSQEMAKSVSKKDSSIVLGDVLVQGPKTKYETTGLQNFVLDSSKLNRFQNPFFGDLLNQQNLFFVKSYGLGALATPGYRGTSAEHTAILWNGFNLQSPMNGTLDFSLLPPEFIGEAQIQPGSNGAKWGSGSIGGSIQLLNPIRFGNGLRAGFQTNVGSFNAYRQFVHFSLGQKISFTSIKLLNYDVLNNIPYKNITEKSQPTEYQTNATIKQQGILAEQSFLLTKNQAINLKYWYLNSEREIPSIMGVGKSEAGQQDWFHRIMADWQKQGKYVNWYIRSALFDERILYIDAKSDIYSYSRSISSVSEIENKIIFNAHHSLSFRINNTYSSAKAAGYPEGKSLHRLGGFITYELNAFSNKLHINATLREEVVQGKSIPHIPFLGLDLQLSKNVKLKASGSRAYRIPTFNELYWQPGGNPNLLPEIGWSQEAGVHFQKALIETAFLKWKLNSSATFFSSALKNRIIWQPIGYGIYNPINIQEVWARGVEFNLKSELEFQKSKLELNMNYDFTRSTTEKVEDGQENQLRKQLMYIPFHKASAGLIFSWRNFCFAYNHAFKGYRYIVADNKSFLPNYSIGDFQISKILFLNRFSIKVFGQINNVWNEDYQVLAFRPMPQRNYLCGIAFQFYQPSKPKSQ